MLGVGIPHHEVRHGHVDLPVVHPHRPQAHHRAAAGAHLLGGLEVHRGVAAGLELGAGPGLLLGQALLPRCWCEGGGVWDGGLCWWWRWR